MLNNVDKDDIHILEACVLTHLSTILSLVKYTCRDGLSCTVYVTNKHIVHQFMLLIFSVLSKLLEISKGNRPLRCTIFF